MPKRTDICALLLLAVIGCASAWAQAEDAPKPNVDQAKVEELTDLVAQMFPGEFIQNTVEPVGWESNPRLLCVHEELSPDTWRKTLQKDVSKFALRYPDEVDDSVRVLKNGAAEMYRATFIAYITQTQAAKKKPEDNTGAAVNQIMQQVSSKFTPAQEANFLEFMVDSKHQHLRGLTAIEKDPPDASAMEEVATFVGVGILPDKELPANRQEADKKKSYWKAMVSTRVIYVFRMGSALGGCLKESPQNKQQ